MINFMSSYQAPGKKGKKFFPKGCLCWYGCNQYGEPNGYIQPIKLIPEFIWFFEYGKRGFPRLKKERSIIPTTPEVLTRDPLALEYDKSCIPVELSQESKRAIKRRKQNACKEK